jgi:hypothetical protein
MTKIITSVVELAGATAVTIGAFSLTPWAGWIVGGVFAMWAARSAST